MTPSSEQIAANRILIEISRKNREERRIRVPVSEGWYASDNHDGYIEWRLMDTRIIQREHFFPMDVATWTEHITNNVEKE